MAASERLALLITANGSQAISEFQKTGLAAQKALDTTENSTARLSQNLIRVGAGMAAIGGIALVGLYKAAQAAQEEDRAILALNNSIQNSPELVGASTDAFLDQAAALQDTTKFTDDATISAQAMLGTFHLTQAEILGLTPLVQDLASKFDLDLNRASILVGKAMDGNVGTLQRMGVRIDENAFATDRYAAVIQALRENAGGFAEQEGETFNGQLAIMRNNLADVSEGIGRGAVEAFNSLLGPVKSVSDAFTSLSPGVQGAVGKVAAFTAVGLIAVGGMSMLAGAALKLREAYLAMAAAQSTSGAAAALAAAGPYAAVAAAILGIAVAADAASSPGQAEGFVTRITGGEEDIRSVAAELANLTDLTTNYGRAGALAGVTNAEIAEIVSGVGAIDPSKAQELTDELVRMGVDADVASSAVAAIPHLSQAEAAEQHAQSVEELEAAYQAVNTAIDEYLERAQSVEETAAGEAEAQQALFDALTENRQTFDVNTVAGRQNIQMRNNWIGAVTDQVQAAVDYAAAGGNVEVAQRRANNAIQAGIGDLRRMKAAGLITADQFATLRDRLQGVQDRAHISGSVTIAGAETAISQMHRLYQEAVNAGNAVDQVSGSLAGGGVYGRAHGGFIREGEVARVHTGETVTQRGGVATVTPASQVQSAGFDYRRMGKAIARELAIAGIGASPTINVRSNDG